MDQLAPSAIPLYETTQEGHDLWKRCADRNQPVIAVREGERGYIVRYDLHPVDGELTADALTALRSHVKSLRQYTVRIDPLSETEAVGGESGRIAGDLHTETEREARQLASHVSSYIFDESNRV